MSQSKIAERVVILHYHLFKNAGTSVDALLKENFPGKWCTREFPGNPVQNRKQVKEWIESNPDMICFSSHTAVLPPPEIPGVKVLPIIFLRHPIDRIASAYHFEKKQGGDSFGAVLARNTTLAGYIEVRLSLPNDRQCENFHCTRLAQMFGAEQGSVAERAIRVVAALPFVGLVAAYDESIRRMTDWLKPHFPQIAPLLIAKNVSRNIAEPLEVKLAQVRDEIGNALYTRLEMINAADFVVYEAVRENCAAL